MLFAADATVPRQPLTVLAFLKAAGPRHWIDVHLTSAQLLDSGARSLVLMSLSVASSVASVLGAKWRREPPLAAKGTWHGFACGLPYDAALGPRAAACVWLRWLEREGFTHGELKLPRLDHEERVRLSFTTHPDIRSLLPRLVLAPLRTGVYDCRTEHESAGGSPVDQRAAAARLWAVSARRTRPDLQGRLFDAGVDADGQDERGAPLPGGDSFADPLDHPV